MPFCLRRCNESIRSCKSQRFQQHQNSRRAEHPTRQSFSFKLMLQKHIDAIHPSFVSLSHGETKLKRSDWQHQRAVSQLRRQLRRYRIRR